MSEQRESFFGGLGSLLGGASFVCFIAIKVAGSSLAAWSWWWLLMTPVPVVALLLEKAGLL